MAGAPTRDQLIDGVRLPVAALEVARDRAGHSDPWETLNTYTHVMSLSEAESGRLMALVEA
jgi:hypothetical protein